MIESPLIDELIAEARHEAIVEVLRTRFGDIPSDLESRIRSIQDSDVLMQMTRSAAAYKDLETFRKSLK